MEKEIEEREEENVQHEFTALPTTVGWFCRDLQMPRP